MPDWPAGVGPILSLKICLYTNSPDGHFILDRHPASDRAILACGFSGHGFQLGPIIGEILAELIKDGHSASPLAPRRVDTPHIRHIHISLLPVPLRRPASAGRLFWGFNNPPSRADIPPTGRTGLIDTHQNPAIALEEELRRFELVLNRESHLCTGRDLPVLREVRTTRQGPLPAGLVMRCGRRGLIPSTGTPSRHASVPEIFRGRSTRPTSRLRI